MTSPHAQSASQARPTRAYAALEKEGAMVPWQFERRAVRPNDVAIKVLFCGVCHSDLHSVNHWASEYPLVPGHEIVGEVIELGADVEGFALGQQVMIGTIVDSCRQCPPCEAHDEVYCREFPTLTFDGLDRVDGSRTRGGYSEFYVSDARFVYPLPDGLDPAAAAPLLCAGITCFAPLHRYGIGPGHTVGVVGIGGLGHLGIKFARAMGAHVVAFTTSPKKAAEAQRLGAHDVVLSTDAEQMQAQAFRFDFILDTVSRSYPMNDMLKALNLDGTLCTLGLPDQLDFRPVMLAMGRRKITSSGTGGTADTQAMLAFCQQHAIVADIELIRMQDINDAFARVHDNDVHYRFVIDLQASAL
ncbi:NAD(P)-dependent alcohol dehydrogenase [Xanthomonas hortorum]|uniref:NAD(P)-dependent alcohol dehydrogenase n=1 Tax=Xanthomonas hortorum TaxID=56454 RepID=UPI000E0E0CCD|nr:NAD(P)-dependent alcohol dehydrogenase [Xanthomonas hortorum]MDV2452330.1 NAD(P)-dependent alcohol dehydrogenase [Xanthomonas hortorum NBC5720]